MSKKSNPFEADNLTSILQDLMKSFSIEELKTLAFELSIDFESLPATGKDAKARELVLSLFRTDRLPELIDAIQLQRPHIERETITEAIQFESLPGALAFLFSEEELKTLAFELGLDYENLPSLGKAAKAQQLVCEIKKRKRLPELVQLCQKKRPHHDDWEELEVKCPRFSRQQIITLAVICMFTLTAGLFWIWWPPPMSGEFNIAIAEIGELNANGRIEHSKNGTEISQRLFEAIEIETDRLPAAFSAQVRSPNLVGIVQGADRDTRAAKAAEIAQRHNANILIYGTISGEEDNQQLQLDFHVTHDGFNFGSEVAGPDRLGSPIPLNNHLSPTEHFDLNSKLNGRSQVLQKLVSGLAYHYIGEFDHAYIDFSEALIIPDWDAAEGKEIIYFLMGSTKLQAYNRYRTREQLESAGTNFSKAHENNNEYARSYLGEGAVTLEYTEYVDEPALLKTYFAQAEGLFLTGRLMPDQPKLAYVPLKSANGLGELYLQARQKEILTWPDQQTAVMLNCTLDRTDEYVIQVGKCAFEQVFELYDAHNQPIELKEFVAHAHSKYGLLASYTNDWSVLISENNKAVDMLQELPPARIDTNQNWIARYYSLIGTGHIALGEKSEALIAYKIAIDTGDGKVTAEELNHWKAVVKDLEENNA